MVDMDAKRFDQFARGLGQRLSRRRFPVLGAAVALIWPVLADDGLTDIAEGKKGKKGKKCKGKNKKKCKGKDKPKGAQCRTSQSSGVVTTTISFSQKPFSLSNVDKTPLDPRVPRTSTTTIRQNSTLLLETQSTVHPDGPIEVRVTYGKVYQGIAEALLTVNGGMISGTVDGRALVPFPATETPDTLQFQDGQPAPETTVNQKLHEAMTKFLGQAKVDGGKCVATTDRKGRDARPRSHDDVGCLFCKGKCAAADFACGKAILGTCAGFATSIPIFGGVISGVCIAIETANCIDRHTDCMDDCRSSKDCCPVQCGTLGDLSCCHANEQCLTFGTGMGQCCAPGETACHEQNCCKPGETCMPGGTCCPRVPCGSQCCGAFDSCCGGQCCTGICNGSVCCTGNESPCGSDCCNGTCCNNTCCPSGRICCNGACCASGQSCVNGTCATVCRPDQEYCAEIGVCCDARCCGNPGHRHCGPPGCVA
jgi:hypothetical protein